MPIDLEGEFRENSAVVVFISNDEYMNQLMESLNPLSKIYEKILYVSANQPYVKLVKNMEKNGIDVNKFFIIDCITLSIQDNPPKNDNVAYINSPSALTDLGISITEAIDNYQPTLFIFDSPSTFLIYHLDQFMVIKLFHNLISRLGIKDIKGLFPCLKEDINESLTKDLKMFADQVIVI